MSQPTQSNPTWFATAAVALSFFVIVLALGYIFLSALP